MPALHQGLTVQIAQVDVAPGTTDLVAAPTGANERIFVVGAFIMMTAAGTIQFKEGTSPTNLTPIIPIDINAGFVYSGTTQDPILWTQSAKVKLSLTAATGTARGWIRYFIGAQSA